ARPVHDRSAAERGADVAREATSRAVDEGLMTTERGEGLHGHGRATMVHRPRLHARSCAWIDREGDAPIRADERGEDGRCEAVARPSRASLGASSREAPRTTTSSVSKTYSAPSR